MNQRMDIIQKMRNQEATSHYQLNQALKGTSYDYGIRYGDSRMDYRKQAYGEEVSRSGFSSFKLRCLLALFLGIFLFSMQDSEKGEILKEAVAHIGENPTIEEAADKAEIFVKQAREVLGK